MFDGLFVLSLQLLKPTSQAWLTLIVLGCFWEIELTISDHILKFVIFAVEMWATTQITHEGIIETGLPSLSVGDCGQGPENADEP